QNLNQQLTATVTNDQTNSGVTWALSQSGTACITACGSLSTNSSPSGVPITYTAPASVPPDPLISVNAISNADPRVSTSARLTITTSSVTLSPTKLDFGRVVVGQAGAPQTATLTNGPSTTLDINSVTITGASSDYSQTNNCGTSLGMNQSCSITVIFKPTG